MSRIVRHQRKFNRATRDSWVAWTEHRERVMEAVLDRTGGRVAVLGAGNANDIDLPRLLEGFDEVHLVDLDEEALRLGVHRQGADGGNVVQRGGVDLSGLVPRLDALWEAARDLRPPTEMVDEAVAAAEAAPAPALGGPFDVVVSACVLTQLVDQAVNSLGAEHPGTPRLATALRDRHLRLMLELTSDGGRSVLVTDALSTAAHPALVDVTEAGLPAFFERCARSGRCFAGTDPKEIREVFGRDPRVVRTFRTTPWLWTMGLLSFAVYALRIDCRE